MPCQFFNALIIVVINELFVFILIVHTHDAFQQCIREFQFANLFHQHLTSIDQEFIIAVCYELISNYFFYFSAEFFFSLHYVFTTYLVKDFLSQFSFYETSNFFYLIAEVRFHFSSLFLVDLQQRRQFGSITFPCSVRIEYKYIVYLCIGENSFLLIVLHIRRHHYSTFYLDTTFFGIAVFVQLSQQTFQHILIFVNVYFLVLTVTLCISFHLIVYHIFGNVNQIVVYFIFSVYFSLEFRCQSNIKQEFEFFHSIEVDLRLLVFVWQRFAEDRYIIILNILIYSF